ncbi:MAG: GGDEF domain-containing response regulator [Gemmatimonadales bacterium]
MDDNATELTILVANDQEWAARSLESILVGEGYRVVRAYNGRQALDRAASSKPDAVILDMQMPDFDGLTVCQTLRSWPGWSRSTPIFITTAGPSGRQERFAAYRAGAWEFFGHPLDPEAILVKLQVFLDAKSASDASREGGLIDEASGLYNRRGLIRRSGELWADAARRKERVSCVLLRPTEPLEQPPSAADGLAKQLGEVLRRAGRSSDAIGRLGPLQFAVVAVGAGEVLGQQLADRVNELAARAGLGQAMGRPDLTFCATDLAASEVEPRFNWD